ncbi:MAG: hypothetical protein LBP52_08110 [Burkholderiaceae bacterium]|nr:hypothetical protein [Burkholderiaceae bacterium]
MAEFILGVAAEIMAEIILAITLLAMVVISIKATGATASLAITGIFYAICAIAIIFLFACLIYLIIKHKK